MSFLRYGDRSFAGPLGADALGAKVEIRERRAVRAERLGVGTLACDHCDAPVVLGGETRSLAELLTCPFCAHSAPARDFLAVGVSRPARVIVWVSRRAPAA